MSATCSNCDKWTADEPAPVDLPEQPIPVTAGGGRPPNPVLAQLRVETDATPTQGRCQLYNPHGTGTGIPTPPGHWCMSHVGGDR